MDFDKIMQEITAGLSGDNQRDIGYLKEQMEKYKNHEYGKEILRACGRLIYEKLPDEVKNKVNQVAENEDLGIKATLDEVGYCIYKKDFDKALNLMEALVSRIEEAHKSGLFQDDAVSTYHNFDELFEEILYRHLNESEKEVRRCPMPFHQVYARYGALLFEMKRYEEAEKALETAIRWNPVFTDAMFERAECHKALGNLEVFFNLTVEAFKYAFRPKAVARCFRNLGYYFVEKELWDEAVACYIASMDYEKDALNAQSELYYIQRKAGRQIPPPAQEAFESYGEKYGFPVHPSEDILGIPYAYGKHAAELGNSDAARYFWTVFYDLTGSTEIKSLIDSLPESEG